jgi:hypothetical protein
MEASAGTAYLGEKALTRADLVFIRGVKDGNESMIAAKINVSRTDAQGDEKCWPVIETGPAESPQPGVAIVFVMRRQHAGGRPTGFARFRCDIEHRNHDALTREPPRTG